MNDPSIRNPSYQSLTDQQFFELDELCDRFDRELASGSGPRIETFLAEAPEAARDGLRAELLTIEVDFRLSRGEQASADDYLSRFPDHAKLIENAFDFARNSDVPTGLIGRFDEMTLTIAAPGSAVSRVGTTPQDHRAEDTTEFVPQPFGRYTLQRLLGKGGMGSVYLAHDRELDRKVAIKFPEFDDRPDVAAAATERFRREARAMATMHHPNICPIFDVGQHDGRHYLTMAYIDGRSLSEVAGSRSQAEIVRLIMTTARALHAAHQAGVVHRDLKPSNVMLDKRGEPIVMDFGLASRTAVSESGLTHSGVIIGSPAYMAPEQVDAAHDKVGPRTDVYALGVILYQLLTGRRPFDGAGLSVLGKIAAGVRPEPPSQIAAVSLSLEAICLKAMAYHIEDRFQSAEELAASLDDWLRTPDAAPVEAHSSRRKTVLIAGGLLMLAVGSLLMAVVFRQGHDQRPTDLDLTAANSSVGSQTSRSASASGSSVAESGGANNVREPTHPGPQKAALPAKKLHPFLDDSYEWTPPVELGPGINGAGSVDHACISSDGLLMVMSRIENRRSQLWWSVRESERDPFPAASPLPPEVNSDQSDQTPFLSRDGLSLWFASSRSGGAGRMDLYVSRRKSVKDSFDPPVSLGPTINSPGDETSPFVTADELTLLFAAGLPRQIYQAKRKSKEDSFATPQRLVRMNGSSWQEFPRLSQDGLTLVLVVSRSPGGEQRLEIASRPTVDADFDKPVDLGPVNRGVMSGLSLSGDETTVYFSASQTPRGTRGLWMSRRTKKPSQVEPAKSAQSSSSPPPAVAPFDATQASQHQEAWAKHLDLPVEYTNSIGMKFRLLPPGEFLMGSTPEEIEAALNVSNSNWREHIESEGPQHKVLLTKPIYVGVTEVTQSQYQQVMGANPSHFSATGKGNAQVTNIETGNHPVETVSWYDAADFCATLSQQEKLKPFYSRSDETVTMLEGTGYRLPTEAEWEYACRAGTTTRFWSGDQDQDLIAAGWHSGNGANRTHAAGESKPNPFGLSDMHGNVWEWVQDGWDPEFYSQFQKIAALDPFRPFLADQDPRPLRGGDWHSAPFECRSTQRLKSPPNFQRDNMGFRVVLLADAVAKLPRSTGATTPPQNVAPFDEAQAKGHQVVWAQ